VSLAVDVESARWTVAEAHLIAQSAYRRFIEVEPWQVIDNMGVWRRWFYGLLPTATVLRLPGVHQTFIRPDWQR